MIRIPGLLIAGTLALACLATRARAQEAGAQTHRWEDEIRRFEAADRQQPPPQGGVVFVGSSSIRLWNTLQEDFPGVPVINRGFGGSELEDAIRFADRIITPYRPRLVVVYSGDNDLSGGKSPERVLSDYRELVRQIHQELPEARVAFISIKPSIARWHLRDEIRYANDLVRRFSAHDPRLDYIDVFEPMLGADGRPRRELLAEDGLHLTAEGYALWRSLVAPYLSPAARSGKAPLLRSPRELATRPAGMR